MGVGALLANWEMFTLGDNVPGDSISAVMRALGLAQPFIIFMWSMLTGHLWRGKMKVVLVGIVCGLLWWPLDDAVPQTP